MANNVSKILKNHKKYGNSSPVAEPWKNPEYDDGTILGGSLKKQKILANHNKANSVTSLSPQQTVANSFIEKTILGNNYANTKNYLNVKSQLNPKQNNVVDNRNVLAKPMATSTESLSTYKADPNYERYVQKSYNEGNPFGINWQKYAYNKVDNKLINYGQMPEGMTTIMSYLNADEQNQYSYLYGKEGKEVADAYLTEIAPIVSKRKAEEESAISYEMAKKNPFGGFAQTVGGDIVGSLAGGVGAVQNKVNGMLGKDVNLYNPNLMATRLAKQAQAGTKAGVNEKFPNQKELPVIGKLSDFAIDTGVSMVESAIRTLTGSALIGGIQAGLSAGSSAYIDSVDKGFTNETAFKRAVAQGIAEEVFEQFSLDKLLKLKAPSSMRAFFRQILSQGAVEGSEEVFTDIANTLTDEVILGKQSEMDQNVQMLVNNGVPENQAIAQAFKNYFTQLLGSFAGGFVSGIGLGGGKQIADVATRGTARIDVQDAVDVANTIDLNRDSYATDDAYNTAQNMFEAAKKVQDKANQGKKPGINDKLAYTAAEQEMAMMPEGQYRSAISLEEAKRIIENERKQNAVNNQNAQQNPVENNAQQNPVNNIQQNVQNEVKAEPASTKQAQFELIQQSNPKNNNINAQAVWVESVDDIKTFDEAVGEDGLIDWTPDFTAQDVQKALDSGKITVYSSQPIQAGTFVTPSQMEAKGYAGDGKVYSQEVNTSDVAWIDSFEGQYAPIGNEVANGESSSTGQIRQNILDRGRESTGVQESTRAGDLSGAEGSNQAEISQVNSGRPISAIEIGVKNGTPNKLATLVEESYYKNAETPEAQRLKEMVDEAAQHGVSLSFMRGNLEGVDNDGNTFEFRGVAVGKHIYVNIDSKNATPEQILEHELYHVLAQSDPNLVERTRKSILDKYGTGQGLLNALDDYAMDLGLTGMSDAEMLEEFFADTYAGIESLGTDTYKEEVKNEAKGVKPLSKAGVTVKTKSLTKSEAKFSIETDAEGNKLSANQQKYFADSKAVNDNGELIPVYHGSVREFFTFDRSYSNVEGDMGKGFYFTSQKSDAERNYKSVLGADFTQKLEREAERMVDEDDTLDYDETIGKLRKKYATKPTMMPSYLNIKNPVYVGDYYGNRQTYLFDTSDTEISMDDYENEDDYYEALDEEAGELIDKALNNLDYQYEAYYEDIKDIIYNNIYDGGMTLQQLKDDLNDRFMEDEDGNVAGNEIARQLVEGLGYDGIIDSTVSNKFRNMGLAPDAVHYIVFESNQAKLISNENPTNNQDVRYSRETDSNGKKLSENQQKYFENSKVRDDNGRLLTLYHGTSYAGFNEFDTNKSGTIFLTTSKADADSYGGNASGKLYNPDESREYVAKVSTVADILDSSKNYTKDDIKKAYLAYDQETDVSEIDAMSKADIIDAMRSLAEDDPTFLEIEFESSSGKKTLKQDNNRTYQVYANLEHPYIVDYHNKAAENSMFYKDLENVKNSKEYDGLIAKNLKVGRYKNANETVVCVFDSKNLKLTSNENPSNSNDIRYSRETDKKYLDAVKSNDMKTAQKMVDEAAKENGYNQKVYHGTNAFGFTKILTSGIQNYEWSPFFATSDVDTAYTYSKDYSLRKIGTKDTSVSKLADDINNTIDDVYNEAIGSGLVDTSYKTIKNCIKDAAYSYVYRFQKSSKSSENYLRENTVGSIIWSIADFCKGDNRYKWFESVRDDAKRYQSIEKLSNLIVDYAKKTDTIGTYSLYANTDNLLEIDGKGRNWDRIPVEGIIDGKKYSKTRDIASWAKDNDYSGVLIKNIIDNGANGEAEKPANVYIFFNPASQIKSSDPITYDDNGNIIPLSERFNSNNDDIRYSREKSKSQTFKVYHGSPVTDITKYDKTKAGSHSGTYDGQIIWFTDNKDFAKTFAHEFNDGSSAYTTKLGKEGRVYENTITMEKPFDFRNLTEEEYKYIKPWVKRSSFEDALKNNNHQLAKTEVDLEAIEKAGYDGVIAYTDTKGVSLEYGVFNADQIEYDNQPYYELYKKAYENWAESNDTRFSRENNLTEAEKLEKEIGVTEQAARNYETLLASSPELRASSKKLSTALNAANRVVNKTDVKAIAKEMKDLVGSKVSLQKITNTLEAYYQWIHDSEKVDGAEATKIAHEIAVSLVENSDVTYDPAMVAEYDRFKSALKNRTIKITPAVIEAFGDRQSLNAFRKANRNTIKFGTEGEDIDQVFTDLVNDGFDSVLDRDTNYGADQVNQIVDALEKLAPTPITDGEDYDLIVNNLEQKIFDAYFNTRFNPMAKATDIRKYINDYHSSINAYKQQLKKEVDDYKVYMQKNQNKLYADYRQQLKDENDSYRERLKEKSNRRFLEYQYKVEKRIGEARAYNDKQSAKKTIISDTKALSKWLTNPSDKNHVPEAMRKPLADFLENIDFSSNWVNIDGTETKRTLAWKELKDAWSKISEAGGISDEDGNVTYYEVDPDIAATMDELSERIKGIKKIDDLTYVELRDLRNVIKSMKKTIENANKMIATERDITVKELASNSMAELKGFRDNTELDGFVGNLKQLAENKMLSADTRFHTFGSHAEEVYGGLRRGFNVKVKHTREAADYFAGLKNELKIEHKEIREWGNEKAKKITITAHGGETVSLRPSQVMSLYELWKRPQARKHITDGGVVSETKEKEGLKKYTLKTLPVKLNASDVTKLTDQLSDKQKAFADGLTKYFLTTAEWGNEASMRMFGYRKFEDKHYFPIKVDRSTIATRSDAAIQADQVAIKNAGFTKEVKKDAKNALMLNDIVDVFTEQVNGMSNYDAFIAPMSDLLKWFNYQEKDGSSIKQEIERAYGKDALRYVTKLKDDINGYQNADSYFANNMVGLFKGAAVGYNLSVAIQQPTAYARALAVMNPKYLMEGMSFKKASVGDWDNMLKYSGIAQWKDWGFYETDIGKSMRTILTSSDNLKAVSTKKDFKEWLNTKQMTLAEAGDKIAWMALWKASEAQVKDTTDLKPGTDAFFKETAKVFDNIIDRTQVVDSLFSRADVMRSKDSLTKMATSFMNEPMKSYNSLVWAAFDLQTAKTKEQKTKAGKSMIAAASGFLLSNILAAAAKGLIGAMRDKDKEKKYGERWADKFKENIIDNLNPINFVPYIKDIASIFQGYDVNRTDMSAWTELYNTIKRWEKTLNGTGKYSVGSNFVYTLRAISDLTGIAFYGLVRDTDAILSEILNAVDAQEAMYYKEKIFGESIGNNETDYIKRAFKAYSSGKTELGDQIINDIIATGIDEEKMSEKLVDQFKKAPDKILPAIKSNGLVKDEAIEAQYSINKNGSQKKADEIEAIKKLPIPDAEKAEFYEEKLEPKYMDDWKEAGGDPYNYIELEEDIADIKEKFKGNKEGKETAVREYIDAHSDNEGQALIIWQMAGYGENTYKKEKKKEKKTSSIEAPRYLTKPREVTI